MSVGSLSMSQFNSSAPSMNMPMSKPDTGAPDFSSIGSRLGLAQTPSGGAGGFNIGGMAGWGGSGLRGNVK